MLVRFWGVRGTTPVPGATTVRYGGNTVCTTLSLSPEHTLILDAGSGIRSLGRDCEAGPHTWYLLLSHLHWDHIHGLPLFRPLADADATVVMLNHAAKPEWTEAVLEQMDGLHFPVTRKDLQANIVLEERPIEKVLSPWFTSVERIRANHPGECYGYRFEQEGGSLVYLTDNELSGMTDPPTGRDAFIAFLPRRGLSGFTMPSTNWGICPRKWAGDTPSSQTCAASRQRRR